MGAKEALFDPSMIIHPRMCALQRRYSCSRRCQPSFALGKQALHHFLARWCAAQGVAAAVRILQSRTQ